MFKELYTLNPHQGSIVNPLQVLQHPRTSTYILQHLKTVFPKTTDINKTAWIDT